MSKRINRTNLFTNFHVKDLGYYNTGDMKPEAVYPQISEVLEHKLRNFKIENHPEKVHILQTNRDYMIAVQNGKVRVSDIQLSPYLTKNNNPEWTKI